MADIDRAGRSCGARLLATGERGVLEDPHAATSSATPTATSAAQSVWLSLLGTSRALELSTSCDRSRVGRRLGVLFYRIASNPDVTPICRDQRSAAALSEGSGRRSCRGNSCSIPFRLSSACRGDRSSTARQADSVNDWIIIDRRFNGPPNSANGGYACGLVGTALDAPSVRVSLRKPPPLEVPLLRRREDDGSVSLCPWLLDRATRATLARPYPSLRMRQSVMHPTGPLLESLAERQHRSKSPLPSLRTSRSAGGRPTSVGGSSRVHDERRDLVWACD